MVFVRVFLGRRRAWSQCSVFGAAAIKEMLWFLREHFVGMNPADGDAEGLGRGSLFSPKCRIFEMPTREANVVARWVLQHKEGISMPFAALLNPPFEEESLEAR